MIILHRFETDQELNESTLDYVYGYYNHIRPHSSNGYMTPFEKRYSNQWFFSVWMLQKCLTISLWNLFTRCRISFLVSDIFKYPSLSPPDFLLYKKKWEEILIASKGLISKFCFLLSQNKGKHMFILSLADICVLNTLFYYLQLLLLRNSCLCR